MRYFVHMGYNGTKYCGWQRQPKLATVQEVLEKRLAEVFNRPMPVVGCGRTDTKVHASQFFFHIDVDSEIDPVIKFRLNKRLPDDIAIFDIVAVDDRRHARFDATSRTYDYFIHTYKDPFLSNISALYEEELDVISMQKAVALLPHYHNFRPFCKSPDKYKHTQCNVTAAHLYTDRQGERLRFQITSNRFLYRMIRIIAAKLIQIGTGSLEVATFERYLSMQQTPPDIKPAHPQGLFLSKVTYPFLDLPPRTTFAAIMHQPTTAWEMV